MKKKILSISVAAAILASCSIAAIAEDKVPSVYVNYREILFDDQAPVILGEGTTLIPARGVFEAMGATVEWNGETRVVDVTSADNMTLVRLTIDDSTMKVYDLSGMMSTLLSGQDFKAPETPVTLAVAPQIINDRTMIPLRAISEALNAEVNWNGEDYSIDIITSDMTQTPDTAPALSLSASTLTAAEGETFDVFVNAANIPEGMFVSAVSATVKYDKENLEFVSASLVNGETVIEGALGAENPEFADGYLKAAYITIDSEKAAKTEGAVMKLTFKSLTGKESFLQLSDGYQTKLGYNTSILFTSLENEEINKEFDGSDLMVNTNSLIVNASGDEVSATPVPATEPEATTEPAATVTPAPTAAPAE